MTATAEKPTAKELRKQAQALGIEGWEELGRKELAKAIRRAEKSGKNGGTKSKGKKAPKTKAASKPETPAPKTKAKKSVAKKAAPAKTKAEPKAGANEALGLTFAKSHPKPTPEAGVNPFRKNSNLFRVARLLLKGGVRQTLAEKLSQEVSLHPYQKKANQVDLLDYDKRLLLGAQTMRDTFGYGIQRTGRGIEGRILVFVPGASNDPRKGAKKATPAKKKAKK